MEGVHTLVMIKGWLKSIPPESLNPQGAGPWRITFCGILEGFFLVTALLSPEVWVRSRAAGCWQRSTCRPGQPSSCPSWEVVRVPQLWLGFIPALRLTSARPSASPPTEGSIKLGRVKPERWKVYNKCSSFICCFSGPSLLRGAASFWFLTATLLLIWYHPDDIAGAFQLYGMPCSDSTHHSVSCKQKY